MNEDEKIIYDFATELLRNRRASDHAFARGEKCFSSYYAFPAMPMNATHDEPPRGGQRLMRFPQ